MGPLKSAEPQDPFSGADATRCHRITVGDGTRLIVRDDGPYRCLGAHGEPPVLLCLPGISRTGLDFAGLVRRLSPTLRILRPDYRGRGGSGWAADPSSYRPEVYLEDLRHCLTALGIRRIRVVGTSLGGLLSMALCAAMPTVVDAVVINDVGPDIPADGVAQIQSYLNAVTPQPDWPTATAHLQALLPDLALPDHAAWEALARGTYRQDPATAEPHLIAHWDPAILKALDPDKPIPDLWPLFRGIAPRPAVIVRGGLSNILTRSCHERMIAALPHAQGVIVADTGHTPTLEEDHVTRVIDPLLLAAP